ncbi:MAG: UvrB/UvrC motif-containing protein [Mariniblastus sp.]|nr:UvrB/UvrC motif-containing protein [Mariniblastus sp.]
MIEENLEENDVVISSRIRLARNIADYPFISTCSDDQRSQIEITLRSGIGEVDRLSDVSIVNSVELEALERQFLLDLNLIRSGSVPMESDTADSPEETSVEEVGVTINEEDHLRITVTRNDFDLGAAWEQVNAVDDDIESRFNYAFSPRWGYLTACPANVGTGMRVSVLVHLPALVLTHQTEKVFRSVQRINVVARGMFGEGAPGDFFRISNQATLGFEEADLIDQVSNVIPALVKYEREARKLLLAENKEGVRQQVTNALNELCLCDLEDGSEGNNVEIMSLLSRVRMGVSMGLLKRDQADRVNRLFALVNLRHQLFAAVAREDYSEASKLRDRILSLELVQDLEVEQLDLPLAEEDGVSTGNDLSGHESEGDLP